MEHLDRELISRADLRSAALKQGISFTRRRRNMRPGADRRDLVRGKNADARIAAAHRDHGRVGGDAKRAGTPSTERSHSSRVRSINLDGFDLMNLNVLDDPAAEPWYADGLAFTCTQCGNCCTGGPGRCLDQPRGNSSPRRLSEAEPGRKRLKNIAARSMGKYSLTEFRQRPRRIRLRLPAPKPPGVAQGAGGIVQPAPHVHGVSGPTPAVSNLAVLVGESRELKNLGSFRPALSPESIREKSGRSIASTNMRDAVDWPNSPPSSK